MTHGGLTHGGGSMVVRYGGSMVETHGAGGTYPVSQPSVLPSPVIHTDLSAAQLGMIWKQVTKKYHWILLLHEVISHSKVNQFIQPYLCVS